jgi:RNA polymerase sigma-70 factor (ECF subfamily)
MRVKRDEKTLLLRLQAGDETAIEELADAYGARILNLAFRYLRNREDAEEVAQDVLYKVFRKVGTFRGDAALSSWIYRITFNTAMSRLRAARHQGRPEEGGRPPAESDDTSTVLRRDIADWSRMADEQVFRAQLRRRMFRAILALPAIYRAPVVLRDVHGMSTEEASARLHVKDQTLKSRLHRGRTILRKQLADVGPGTALHRAAA